jgi:hypothetical protein
LGRIIPQFFKRTARDPFEGGVKRIRRGEINCFLKGLAHLEQGKIIPNEQGMWVCEL